MSDNMDMPKFLDRRPLVGTFTLLSSYLNCQHAAYRRYVVKDQPYVESKEMKWGNDVHKAFELRIGSRQPLPDGMQQWESLCVPFDGKIAAVEQKLGITRDGKPTGFFDSNVWFRGKVDTSLSQDTTAYLLDWKTGNPNFEDPFELETGALLLKAKRPHLTKIVGSYAWLKENRIGTLYDLSDFQGTWERIRELMHEMENKRGQGVVEMWEKKKSGLCGWCSVSDCENHRPRK